MGRSSRVRSTQAARRRGVAWATRCGHRPLGLGARMGGAGVVLLGDLDLERRQLRVPSVPHCVRTPGVPAQHVVEALRGEPLGQRLSQERHVQGPGAPQVGHWWCGHGGPVLAPMLPEGGDVLALEHAPVADQGDHGSPKPARDLGKLRRQGARLWGLAWTHCHGDRLAVLVAAEAKDHLPLPFWAITIGATGGQGVLGPCQGAPGHLLAKEAHRLSPGARGPARGLDGGLPVGQPRERCLEGLFIKRAEAQHVTGPVRQGQTHGGQTRAWLKAPRDPLPQGPLPCARRPQRWRSPQASGHVVHRPDRPKGHPVLEEERVGERAQVCPVFLVAQSQAERFDLRRSTRTDMGNGALEDLAVGAIRLAQQMPRRGFATTSEVRGIDRQSGYHNSILIQQHQAYFYYKLMV